MHNRKRWSAQSWLLHVCLFTADILQFFLSHHADAFDSFVLLDDDSADGDAISRWLSGARGGAAGDSARARARVELYMRKRLHPCMQELPDRNALLSAARQVGATHALHLDVDELIEWQTMQPGTAPAGSAHPSLFRHQVSLMSRTASAQEASRGWAAARVEMWDSFLTHRVQSETNDQKSFLAEFCFAQALPPTPPPAQQQQQQQGATAAGDAPGSFPFLHYADVHHGSCSMHVPRVAGACGGEDWRRNNPSPSAAAWRASRPSVEAVAARLVHLRFLSRDQRFLKGAWYEIRGLWYAILASARTMAGPTPAGEGSAAASSVSPATPTPVESSATAAEAMRRWSDFESDWSHAAGSALGGAFRKGDQAVLRPLPVDQLLGPQFSAAVPMLSSLKPQLLADVLRLWSAIMHGQPQLHSTRLWKGTRFLSAVDWAKLNATHGGEAGGPIIHQLPFK